MLCVCCVYLTGVHVINYKYIIIIFVRLCIIILICLSVPDLVVSLHVACLHVPVGNKDIMC